MRRKKKVTIALYVLAALIAVGALGLGLHYIDTRDEEDEERGAAATDPINVYLGDLEYEVKDNIESYLLIGTDASGAEELVGTEDYNGAMADFLLLVVLNKTKNTYGFLPIDRNTMASVTMIDAEGVDWIDEEMQICVAHWYGKDPAQGCENTVDTVSDVLGALPIDGYYSINMRDIQTLNHAAGGVTVTVQDDLSDRDPALKPGAKVHLTDEQAEIFVRARMGVGEGDNESRMRRQRAYMSAYLDRAFEIMAEDPAFINDLFGMLQDRAVTNIPGNRISAIANQMFEGTGCGILTIEGERKLGKALPDGLDHEEFYPSEESILEALTTLCGLGEGKEY